MTATQISLYPGNIPAQTQLAVVSMAARGSGLKRIAAVTWMIQPWLFFFVTTAILFVLYRRDFRSEALRAVRNAHQKEK